VFANQKRVSDWQLVEARTTYVRCRWDCAGMNLQGSRFSHFNHPSATNIAGDGITVSLVYQPPMPQQNQPNVLLFAHIAYPDFPFTLALT